MLAKLGGRKLLITLICLASGVAIDLVTERGLSANLLYLMLGIISVYAGANVLTKKVNAAPGEEVPAAPSFDTTGIEEQLDSIRSEVHSAGELLNQVGLASSNTQKLVAAALQSGVVSNRD